MNPRIAKYLWLLFKYADANALAVRHHYLSRKGKKWHNHSRRILKRVNAAFELMNESERNQIRNRILLYERH